MDYSFDLYHPAPKAMRLEMMKEHAEHIEQGIVEAILLKEDFITPGPGFWIAVNNRNSVSFCSMDQNGRLTRMGNQRRRNH